MESIKIGQVLTGEQAKEYLEAGGIVLVDHGLPPFTNQRYYLKIIKVIEPSSNICARRLEYLKYKRLERSLNWTLSDNDKIDHDLRINKFKDYKSKVVLIAVNDPDLNLDASLIEAKIKIENLTEENNQLKKLVDNSKDKVKHIISNLEKYLFNGEQLDDDEIIKDDY